MVLVRLGFGQGLHAQIRCVHTITRPIIATISAPAGPASLCGFSAPPSPTSSIIRALRSHLSNHGPTTPIRCPRAGFSTATTSPRMTSLCRARVGHRSASLLLVRPVQGTSSAAAIPSVRNYAPDPEGSHRKQFSEMQGAHRAQQMAQLMARRRTHTTWLINAFIATNVAVWAGWMFWAGKDDARVRWMRENFTCSDRNWAAGRWWTLLTSEISHHLPLHVLLNMMCFRAIGLAMAHWGFRPFAHFAPLVAMSAIGASMAYVGWGRARKSERSGMGASGINSGLLVAATLTQPMAYWSFLGLFNVRAWQLTLGLAAIDAYFYNKDSPVGHAAHLGGGAAGLAWWILCRRSLGIRFS